MVIMNTKGFMRIIEAVISILLILTAVLIFISQQSSRADISEEVYTAQRAILEVIANNEELRNEVISGKHIIVDQYIKKTFPSTYDFVTSICSVDEICNDGTPNDKVVYVSETIISSSLTSFPDFKSKKLQFYAWRK